MAESLNTELRASRGKRNAKRMRIAGSVPAVLYGHGLENLSLSVAAEQLETVLRHGARVVTLTGAANEKAFVRDMQWNTWGTHVLHVDFTRISEHEKVEVTVHIELRGEAPGLKEGGVVEQLMHDARIECEVMAIPERLLVNVNSLKLNEQVKVSDLELPPTVRVLEDAEAVVVQCVVPAEAPEEEAAPTEGVEPELIGRKAGEEEAEAE
jgi:large subunit ribosomal protein L25